MHSVSPELDARKHTAAKHADALAPGAHAFTTTCGATLTYYVKGTGPRLLVNVAPGWGCASELYQNSFGFLEREFTVVHFEPRGTRGSSFPADLSKMSSWHMAEDVEALRVHLKRDTLEHVLGHSNGGCIAAWHAARFPGHVGRLVLVDAQLLGAGAVSAPATDAILAARPDRGAVEAWKRYRARTEPVASDDEFAAALGSFLALYLARPERDLAALRAAFTNKPQIACSSAQGAAERHHDPDQRPALGRITAQTLVVVGKEDFICPVPVSELLAAGIRDSRLHVIDDAGHFGWIEQQAEFSRVLANFIGY